MLLKLSVRAFDAAIAFWARSVLFGRSTARTACWWTSEQFKHPAVSRRRHFRLLGIASICQGLRLTALYTAFRALEMINEAALQLQALGLATESGCDLEAIYAAIQREIPLRKAQFEALNNEGE